MKDTSVLACIFSEDRLNVLLIKRRDVPVWVLPGGKIEEGETAQRCIIREVKEETGFDVKIIKKIGEYTPINRLTRFTHLFEGSIISGKATIGEETKEVKFFSLSNLPKMPPPYLDWIKDGAKNSSSLIKKPLKQVTYTKLFLNLILHPILVFRFLLSRIGMQINT